MKLRKMINIQYSHKPTQNPHKAVSAQLKHFWCQDEPRATQTHKTHHSPNLGEANTFPLIIYFVPFHKAHIQMTFYPLTPKWESRNYQSRDSRDFGPHNFMCKPLIERRFQTKLYPLSRAFQQYITHHLHARKSDQFLTFNGRELSRQFDSRPFFWP